jgi:RNA polymerase sigma-54 factor
MLIIDDLAFQHGIEVPENIARQALKEVRSLEPVGIGAKDLRDCLMLQLNALPATPNNYIARLIIADHFDEFSLKHFDRIRSLLKLDADTFQKALDTVLNLNPKPGASIGNSQTDNRSQQIIADFIIDIDDDDIRITLNNNIPDLHIEESFENAVARMEANARKRQEQGREFILSRYNDARDFIDALKLRQETLFAVISAIVKIQKEYFLTEDEHNLRPMALKDVAAITGYDISVISRSTANKYISTPWGILPLRFFFSEGVGEGDDEASAREIQAAIKQIIENEDKRRPLSDDLICRKLNEKGYDIRRRTVAKYRDRLGIPVARLRRTSQ